MQYAIIPAVVDVRWFTRRVEIDRHESSAVNARIVRSRLESIIDRQDSVYEQLARKLDLPMEPRRGS